MKTFFIISFVLLSFTINAQIVNIPDANFKQALLDHNPVIDTNGDGEIQLVEAAAAAQLIVQNKQIADLTGIEAFVNLQGLICRVNPIETIDLSNLPLLLQLEAGYTDLTEIDVSQNPGLLRLSVYNTGITELNLANNPDLELLNASYGYLESLDLSNNPNLKILNIDNTNVLELDIAPTPLLESLNVWNTGIDALDFSMLPYLKKVAVGGNTIASLDFSQNPDLCSIYIADCPALEYINLKNGNNELLIPNSACIITLTLGGVSSTSGLYAHNNNPALQTICVDDILFAEEYFTLVPPQTEFTEACNLAVPEQVLSGLHFFPNPLRNVLHLSHSSIISRIEIYSVFGKKLAVDEPKTKAARLDLSEFAAGNYFVSVHSEQGKEVIQIVKGGSL